ncbi:hypothetical protein F8M41_008045 [Gigaspora margarita]|uniref:Uncharacterized protein n=1 Tax=Gigaspora margarita TaxID=4874 RepID=A0A8H4EQW0_GIGMA|nr:hypothetical protein F8M41_008045 [Gigaspora margarita]
MSSETIEYQYALIKLMNCDTYKFDYKTMKVINMRIKLVMEYINGIHDDNILVIIKIKQMCEYLFRTIGKVVKRITIGSLTYITSIIGFDPGEKIELSGILVDWIFMKVLGGFKNIYSMSRKK